MNDERITELFARYRAAYEAGENPAMAVLLAEAGDEFGLLAAVIEEYHASALPAFDLDEIERLAASPAFAPTFGEVLRAAWTEQRLMRRVLVDRLVVELGLRPEARGRLDKRLHEVESGQHSSREVSRRLLAALDRILPGVATALAAARDSFSSPASPSAAGARFSRASDDVRHAAFREYVPPPSEFPEVDELFQAD